MSYTTTVELDPAGDTPTFRTGRILLGTYRAGGVPVDPAQFAGAVKVAHLELTGDRFQARHDQVAGTIRVFTEQGEFPDGRPLVGNGDWFTFGAQLVLPAPHQVDPQTATLVLVKRMPHGDQQVNIEYQAGATLTVNGAVSRDSEGSPGGQTYTHTVTLDDAVAAALVKGES
jgi:hypothetical protein